MAWIESYQTANGKVRWRFVARAADGRRVTRTFHNKIDAERACKACEVDVQRGKAGLLRKGADISAALGPRLC